MWSLSRTLPATWKFIRAGIETTGQRQIPAWLAWEPATATARVNSLPNRSDIDTQVTEQLVVEFYAR